VCGDIPGSHEPGIFRKGFIMSRPSLADGRWFEIGNEAQFTNVSKYGEIIPREVASASRVRKGDFVGAGRYLLLSYEQPCPRGCCYDFVRELIPAGQVVDEVREEMRDLASILRKAKGVE
jgi:hypothetical protein